MTAVTEPPAGAGTTSNDERLVHRGPVQRLLVSPEIGALIGAVLVWAFFWGNGRTFGGAGSTLNFLDVAAPLGIMAVAVALLMIGGEFDLSSGVMTGAVGIMVGLMTKYFAGEGVNLGWAILLAFMIAGAVGAMNGALVNRTGLPSFIVTLATFFALRGMNLVMAKRLEGKVQVDEIKKQPGSGFFQGLLTHEWRLDTFGARDSLLLILGIGGLTLLGIGLLEQSLVRRAAMATSGLLVAAVGAAAGIGGLLMAHNSDGTGANAGALALGGAGIVVTVFGLASARFEPRGPSTASLEPGLWRRVGIGAGLIVLACLVPLAFDRDERKAIQTWVPDGLRPVVAIAGGLLGLYVATKVLLPRFRSKASTGGALKLAISGLYGAAVGGFAIVSVLQLATVQALRAVSLGGLAAGGLVVLLGARGRAGHSDGKTQMLVGLAATASVVALAFVIRADSDAEKFRSGLFTAMMVGAAILLANTVVESRFAKRRTTHPAADKLGKRLVTIGGLIAAAGLIQRVIYSNEPDAKGSAIIRMSVVWWVVATVVGAFVLNKTKWGNWIFAVGGNKDAARAIGVPADRVKTGLFVTTALAGCFVGVMTAMRYGTVQAGQGVGEEFEYIIAAVVGGCLLTGGYGSVIGASVGAVIMAMSTNGISSAGWNSDGRFAFLGVVLLVAVLVNNFTRKKAQEAR